MPRCPSSAIRLLNAHGRVIIDGQLTNGGEWEIGTVTRTRPGQLAMYGWIHWPIKTAGNY